MYYYGKKIRLRMSTYFYYERCIKAHGEYISVKNEKWKRGLKKFNKDGRYVLW